MKSWGKNRLIFHLDLDAFFAAVEVIKDPSLKGLPVVIGADPEQGKGRGVVSTASYEAREYGIRSAMPISKAWSLCKNAVFLVPDYESYSYYSRSVFEIVESFTPVIEQVGIDEAFMDCGGLSRLWGEPEDIALGMQRKIFDITGLSCSIGVATNKSIAKIASDYKKPGGITIVFPGKEEKFLDPLEIKRLWGAGPKTVERLNRMGLYHVRDISSLSQQDFMALNGSDNMHLWYMAKGIDSRPVVSTPSEYQSLSAEHTFDIDTSDIDQIESACMTLCDSLVCRLRRYQKLAGGVGIKIRDDSFFTITRSKLTGIYSDSYDVNRNAVMELLKNNISQMKKVRLIGCSLYCIKPATTSEKQLALNFDNSDHYSSGFIQNAGDKKKDKLYDLIYNEYKGRINRASILQNDSMNEKKK